MSGKCLAGTVGWSAGNLRRNVSVRRPVPPSRVVGEPGGPKGTAPVSVLTGALCLQFPCRGVEIAASESREGPQDPGFPAALFFNAWIPDPFGIVLR